MRALFVRLPLARLALFVLQLAACGASPSVVPASSPVAAIPPSVDLSAVARDSGLPANPLTDTVASFDAPQGQAVRVLIRGPAGVTAQTACPGPDCLVMRALALGESPDDYFPAALQAAQSAGVHKLVIPPGHYDFKGPTLLAGSDPNACNQSHYWNCAPHWTLASLTDLDIDLSGSTLNFAAPGIGLWIHDVTRLRLENLTLDWPTLRIASLGTIVADPGNPGHRALALDAGYPVLDPLTGAALRIEAVDPWEDSIDPALAPGRFALTADNAHETYFIFGGAPQPTLAGAGPTALFSCVSCNFVNGTSDPACSMFLGCANFDVFATGERVLVRHYTYNGFAVLINWSNDVDLEHVTLLTGPGMGIGLKNAAGYRGLRVGDSSIERAPGRLISTASDGINVSQFGGDVLIENAAIGHQGDDAVNVSPLQQSFSLAGAGLPALTGACGAPPRDGVLSGDVLAFFDAAGNDLGNAAAGTVSTSTCAQPTLPVPLDCAGSATCQAMVAALTSGETLVDLTQQPVARYILRNDRFHENRGHGAFLGSPWGAVTGNTFFRNSMGPTTVSSAKDLTLGSVSMSGNTQQ